MIHERPVIAATGLICLDIVHASAAGEAPLLFAGGSALNAPVILSTMGWQALIAGRIGSDRAQQHIFDDLSRFNVSTSFIDCDPAVHTPVYFQTFDESGHRFQRQCLDCGGESPSYVPHDDQAMRELTERLPDRIDAVIIERDSPAALRFARACKQRGALVYVELNRMSDEPRCIELIGLADVYKYARDRCGMLPDDYPHPALEIETMGKDGLRYRRRDEAWKAIPPLQANGIIDAAGSGDWVTATLLNELGHGGCGKLTDALKQPLDTLFENAQHTAIANARYIGARGRLYEGSEKLRGDDACPFCGSEKAVLN